MLKISKLYLVLFLCIVGCSSAEECPENINLLPMYGTEPKCQEQIDTDKKFIDEVNKKFKNNKIAAEYYIDKGWEFLYKEDYQSAMKRFNQAWLLDSTNAKIYWGFGNVLGIQRDFINSTKFLEKSIRLDSTNAVLYEDNAMSYAQLFVVTNDSLYLNKSIKNFKTAIHLEPNNARVLGQLTTAYVYANKMDSANYYLHLMDKIDSKAINSEIRNILSNKESKNSYKK